MHVYERRTCKACERPIAVARVWYLEDVPVRRPPTWMPLDLDPLENADGNIAVHRSASGALRARVLHKGEDLIEHEVRAMPHFATCQGKAPRTKSLPDNVVALDRARRRHRVRRFKARP